MLTASSPQSLRPKRIVKPTPHIEVGVIVPLDSHGRETLSKDGIVLGRVPKEIVSVTVVKNSRVYHAAGIVNLRGGLTFYCGVMDEKPVTAGRNGVVMTIEPTGIYRSQILCVFEDIRDYFAFLFLKKKMRSALPCRCDCLVIGSPKNFEQAKKMSEDYKKVLCFPSNTEYGMTIYSTLKQLCKTCYAPILGLYGQDGSIFNHVKNNQKYML